MSTTTSVKAIGEEAAGRAYRAARAAGLAPAVATKLAWWSRQEALENARRQKKANEAKPVEQP
jgi:hypothetical protein